MTTPENSEPNSASDKEVQLLEEVEQTNQEIEQVKKDENEEAPNEIQLVETIEPKLKRTRKRKLKAWEYFDEAWGKDPNNRKKKSAFCIYTRLVDIDLRNKILEQLLIC